MLPSPTAPHLETPRLLVRMGTYQAVPAIAHFYQENRDFLRPFEPYRPDEFFTEAYWQVQIERNNLDFANDQALRLFLFARSAPTVVIGSANFNQFFRYPFHACVLGYSLAETKQGQGLMAEALQAAIAYMFDTQNFHRISANYMPHNQRSGNLLKKLGFTVEGYARDYLLINNQWADHILTTRVNPNWRSG